MKVTDQPGTRSLAEEEGLQREGREHSRRRCALFHPSSALHIIESRIEDVRVPCE